MKAVRFHSHGGVEVLGVEEVEPRPLGPRDDSLSVTRPRQ